nr:unnamed protein product [Callosobruchus chinensis]
MQSREEQSDSSVTRPLLAKPTRRRAFGDLSLFYRYSNEFCSSELTSIFPQLVEPARCTRGTSCSHPTAVILQTSRIGRYDRTFVPRVSRAWNGLNLTFS